MAKLAIDGGEKVRKIPMPPRRLFGEEEKSAVIALFDRSIETGEAFGYNGIEEQSYEKEFAEFMGGGYADLVNSGTSAIFVALGALNLEPLSEVIAPPITDPGGVMPIPMLNCVPIIADANKNSYNVGPDQIEAVITERTKAIVVAHIFGEPADMDPIMEIARSKGLFVIEDCAQAHGALYKGRLVGTFGDLSAFSTMSGKHHATGAQGGVVFTKNADLYWEAKRFADRGKPFNTTFSSNVRIGLNLNSNELSATIGRVQLRKLPRIIEGRRNFVRSLAKKIKDLKSITFGWMPDNCESSYWYIRMHIDLDKLSVSKDQFVNALSAEGIPCFASYRHIPSEAKWFIEKVTYGKSGYPWTDPNYKGERNPSFPLPNCIEAVETHFNLVVNENYGEQEAIDYAEALHKVESAYLK
ncbi:TPA: DegT/DnrJ/EryC1/StrS family aminotransferase [Candidatus Poribacteria bacterium]|nr:DegT/DnrJ/EryC1/StrS family aminotransferase [Candidatus Poribacteria bacterium]